MANWTQGELFRQLEWLKTNEHFEMLRQEAHEANQPLAFVLAICSRETNCRNELGDYRDGVPHGVGLMQVDVQHDFARAMRDDGTWITDPRRLVRFACGLLYEDILAVNNAFPDLDEWSLSKVAAAAYNCGLTRAKEAHEAGDCDRYTTGHDYGADVMARMEVFLHLLDQE